MNIISTGPNAAGVDPVALDVVKLTQELVRINSISPDLVPDAAGEAEIVQWCAAWLSARGFEVRQVGPAERPSIIGIARGTGGGKSLMLNGHVDTVGVAGYDGDPFAAEVRDGNVYGRRHLRHEGWRRRNHGGCRTGCKGETRRRRHCHLGLR